MKSFYFTAVADSFFTSVASFFVLLVVSSSFIPYPITLIFSGSFAIIFGLFAFKNQVKKGKQKGLDLLSNKKFTDAMTQLNLMPVSEGLEITEKLLKKENFSVERKRGGIAIKEKGVIVFFKFGFDQLTKTDVVKYFNRITNKEKAVILSQDFSKDVCDFAKRFNGKIILISGKEFFEALIKHDLLPPNKYELLNKNGEKPNLFKNLTDKKRAKSFLSFGLIFLGFSYFAPIKTYYVVVGAIMLCFSLYLRLFGKSNPSPA